MGNRIVCLALVVVVLCVAAPTKAHAIPSICDALGAANLVQNCGFETGNFNKWTYDGDQENVNAVVTTYNVNSGNNVAALGTTDIETISQPLTTIGGQTYALSFYLWSDGLTSNYFSAELGSLTPYEETDLSAFGYTLFTFYGLVPGADATLTFSFQDQQGYVRLDDVSVWATPEPSSLGLMVLGLLMVAIISRRIGRTRKIWITSVVLAAVLLSVHPPECNAQAPHPHPRFATIHVDGIHSFVSCLNAQIIKGESANIASTVQCIPSDCNFTLTMSAASAQAACPLGGVNLPRVILSCPIGTDSDSGDELYFRPSYLFCPIDSAGADDTVGADRVELGEDVNSDPGVIAPGSLAMADVPLKPTQSFVPYVVSDVYSVDPDSKGCNTCHGNAGTLMEHGLTLQLSEPILPWDEDRVIFSNDPTRPANIPNPEMLATQGIPQQTLPQVCACISNNKAAISADIANKVAAAQQAGETLAAETNLTVLTDLCTALLPKLGQAAGTCGATKASAMVRTEVPQGYRISGGGAFTLRSSQMSALTIDLSAVGSQEGANSVRLEHLRGNLIAYNHVTNTRVRIVSISSGHATVLNGGDFELAGTGKASVNGVTEQVEFLLSQVQGTARFSVGGEEGDTLAGGTNFSGAAALQLIQTSP